MEDNTGLKKFFKWAGIIALLALPVVVLLKRKKDRSVETIADDESNIFSAELEE